MKPLFSTTAAILALFCHAGSADAATVQIVYNGSTTGVTQQTAKILQTPAGATGKVVAHPFDMTDTSGPLGDFVAFCLDLANTLKNSHTYDTTETPFSNEFVLGAAEGRIQALYDANYGTVDLTNQAQGAAFQLSLWEVLYDGTSFDLASGAFQAIGNGTSKAQTESLAATYLSNAASFSGPKVWDLTFLESIGINRSQNLVTAQLAAVPLPAAGLLLIAGLGGLGAFGRRRRT